MAMYRVASLALAGPILLLAACGDSRPEPLFQPKPACEGQAITPLEGQHPSLISFIEIGAKEDGFDLDGNSEPDNKLASIRSLANDAIEDAFANFSILIPIEFFDFETPGVDECVKFAVYLGAYKQDMDLDGHKTADAEGDCSDLDSAIHKGAEEVVDNGKDDDCDSKADEVLVDGVEMPSTNVTDADADGLTIADGDCDDTSAMIGNLTEICGDGLDNDCDGNADHGFDANGNLVCSPYDDTPDAIGLDPLAFEQDGAAAIAFTSGQVRDDNGRLVLEAGPAVFGIHVPIINDISLELRITGATIVGDVVMTSAGWSIQNGRLGGVIDAYTSDQIRGLEIPEISLEANNSLLDVVFANLLGSFLALPPAPTTEYGDTCRTPDIDVDRDGLEIFCDSDPIDDIKTVDVCVDGDGTVILDEVDAQGNVTRHCAEAVDAEGNPRFVDGISVEFNFTTTPVILPDVLPPLQ